MMPMYVRQILAVLRLELKKTFFARRGLWVYLVALAPALLYVGQDIEGPRHQKQLEQINRQHPLEPYKLANVTKGQTKQQVIALLGRPYSQRGPFGRPGRIQREIDWYTDGKREIMVEITDGLVTNVDPSGPPTIEGQTIVFATLFQNVYLRLGVFFGCIGIFANLFRGEMLDKSLHYYLLTPMPREVLVAGKFLAGLLVMCAIFCSGTTLQFAAMLGQFDRSVALNFLHTGGSAMLWSYVGVTLLACVAYGSLFVALGLLFRNPVVPAAFVLMWESIVMFMPVSLKELSIIYYLQCICPVAATVDKSMPAVLKMLVTSDSDPVTRRAAIVMLLAVSTVCLGIAAFRGRRLEINYAVE
jgi:ABC-type transport system involved in multi-copper enzyme maturation permease subunit